MKSNKCCEITAALFFFLATEGNTVLSKCGIFPLEWPSCCAGQSRVLTRGDSYSSASSEVFGQWGGSPTQKGGFVLNPTSVTFLLCSISLLCFGGKHCGGCEETE